MDGLKLIWEPGVFLIGKSAVDPGGMAAYLEAVDAGGWRSDGPSGGEQVVEAASRGCYDSYRNPRPGGNAAHIGHILEMRHGSVAEHAIYTLAIIGVSRTLTHELIRHRHLSPSQRSQRFVDESECAFVVPPALIGGGDDKFRYWVEIMDRCASAYRVLAMAIQDDLCGEVTNKPPTAVRKAARESARSVLPGCVETRIVLTGNARAWRGVLEQRGAIGADREIRRLAPAILRVLKAESPNLFADMEAVPLADGIEGVTCKFSKV